jgi:GT2 family glycosyltransferase
VHDPVDASDTPVTAVLCVYTEQRWAMIEAAVESLRNQTAPPAQLLMVVDYNDTLRERATRAFTGVDVVANVHTKGLSGAKNTALDHATQPIITVLDDDAVADPKWIATLLAHFDDPSVVAVGSAVDANWEDRRPVWFAAEFDWTLGCSYVGLPEDVTDVRNVFGGAMAMRRDAAVRAGGFLAELGRTANRAMGCEETEFCIRLQRDNPGSRIVFDPSTRVQHFVPHHRARWSYFVRRCYGEGVSKVAVAHHVGRNAGLASERRYLTHTIPWGVARYLRRGRISPVAAIVVGCTATAVGFASGTISMRRPRRHR